MTNLPLYAPGEGESNVANRRALNGEEEKAQEALLRAAGAGETAAGDRRHCALPEKARDRLWPRADGIRKGEKLPAGFSPDRSGLNPCFSVKTAAGWAEWRAVHFFCTIYLTLPVLTHYNNSLQGAPQKDARSFRRQRIFGAGGMAEKNGVMRKISSCILPGLCSTVNSAFIEAVGAGGYLPPEPNGLSRNSPAGGKGPKPIRRVRGAP